MTAPRFPFRRCAIVALASFSTASLASAGDDPFADAVVSYAPGDGATEGFTDPQTSLGSPERLTGEGFFPGVVSVLNGAWRPDEIVSIGAGGHLVVRFDTPVTDDPHNPFGVDLLVFGNAFLSAGPAGDDVADPPFCFCENGSIEVSVDGETWILVPDLSPDGMFPTEGFLDGDDPYAGEPGDVPSDFTRPVDPALTMNDLAGLTYVDVLDHYRGSGGGAGIDLAPLGLVAISYVRISAPPDATDSPEIDGFADVRARRPGDVDADGAVDFDDLLSLLFKWGPSRPHGWDADFDGSGDVGFTDLLVVLFEWDP